MFSHDFEDVFPTISDECEIMLGRVGSEKYNAHFLRIMMCGMSIWTSFETVIAFLEYGSDVMYIRSEKSLGFKTLAHAEYLFVSNKSHNKRRIYTQSKFLNLFNSAFHRSIVKYAQTIMTKRLLKED